MKPVLFEFCMWGNKYSILSYVVFNIVLSGLSFIVWGLYILRRKGIPPKKVFIMIIGAVFVALVGSRLTYAMINWNQYQGNVIDLFAIEPRGLAMYGGFLYVLLYIVITCCFLKLDAWRVLDAITPGWSLSVFFNKIGCFLNGCCFGTPTTLPWGITPPEGSRAKMFYESVYINGEGDVIRLYYNDLVIHPVQMYESFFGLVGFLVSIYMLRKKLPSGIVFLTYSAAYSFARFFFQYLRAAPTTFQNEIIPYAYLLSSFIALLFLYREYRKENNPAC
jgi:phosphatidylglycerol:prolipoprotein diacylglycerol transferase